MNQNHFGNGDNIAGNKYVKLYFPIKFSISIIFLTLILVGAYYYYENTTQKDQEVRKLFSEENPNFKILILPFKELCELGGKNYDAGYVLQQRLNTIIEEEDLKIEIVYANEYDITSLGQTNSLNAHREYHFADMIIYGSYFTSDCSSSGDKICLNYIVGREWRLGQLAEHTQNEYLSGGFDELRNGLLQERIENAAIIFSILGQIKNVNPDDFSYAVNKVLDLGDFTASVRSTLFIELAMAYEDQGFVNKALTYYHKALEESAKLNILQDYGIASKWIAHIYYIHKEDTQQSSYFIDQFQQTQKKLNELYPDNLTYKYELGLSYWAKTWNHTFLDFYAHTKRTEKTYYKSDSLNMEECIHIFRDLHNAAPEDRWYRRELALAQFTLCLIDHQMGYEVNRMELFQAENIARKLHVENPNNYEYQFILDLIHYFLQDLGLRINPHYHPSPKVESKLKPMNLFAFICILLILLYLTGKIVDKLIARYFL